MLTKEELIQKVKDYCEKQDINFSSMLQGYGWEDKNEEFEKEFDFSFVYNGSADHNGAENGDGHTMIWVFKIGDRMFEVTGYYSSHDSSEIYGEYDWTQVELAKREVTYFKEVQNAA